MLVKPIIVMLLGSLLGPALGVGIFLLMNSF
jgi:hypothetical protein